MAKYPDSVKVKKVISTFLKSLFGFYFLFASSTPSFAQKEANHWYFGNNAGLDFSGGAPVAVSDGALVSMEGVASISDNAGNLLFYTDGMTIYDKTHNPMPNGSGLLGGSSSSQSAVAIKKPGSNSIYYVFTAAQDKGPDGICYSVVNTTLNSGNGDVTGTKNVKLLGPATEKLTAVKHCNRKDVWVLAHELNSNRLFAWLVTSSGVSASPVISSVGNIHNGEPIGCMKVSPDGKHLALAHYHFQGDQFIEFFDFDNATGIVSNPTRIDYAGNCYGVEFSPNSQFLYYTASTVAGSLAISIFQIDLCAGSKAQVKASAQPIGTSSNGYTRTIQLGPDGKIYFSRFATGWVGAIQSPNIAGPACNYVADAVPLVSGTICRAGLANFNQSFLKQELDFQHSVNCYTANFSAQKVYDFESCTDPISSIKWIFGDPSSGAANTSNLKNPSHTFSAPGTYPVSLIVNYNCGSDTVTKTIDIDCGPQVVVNNPDICAGICTDLLASASGGKAPYTYVWSPALGAGPGPHNVCPSSNTNYTVTVTDANGKTHSATAKINISSVPTLSLNGVNPSCKGDNNGSVTAAVTGNGGPFTFSWNSSPIQNGATLNNVGAGTYTVTVKNAKNCTSTATTTLSEPNQISITLINKTDALCKGANDGSATVSATGGVPPYSFSWSAGQNGASVNNLIAATHTATVTDANGCSASIQVSINEPAAINISTVPTNASCGNANGSIQANVSGGNTPYTYSWNTSPVQSNSLATALSAGTYTLALTDANGCKQTKSETVTSSSMPVLNINTQQVSCFGANDGMATATGSTGTPPYTFSWSNGANSNSISNLGAANYTVTLSDAAGCSATQSFNISEPTLISLNISSTAATCGAANGSASVSISGGTAPYTTSWSSGSSSLNAPALAAGSYTVTVTDANACSASTTVGVSNSSGPTINLIASKDVQCYGGSDGEISIQVNGGAQPVQISWSNGFSGNHATGLYAGTYTITLTDAFGCSANLGHEVKQPQPLQLNINTTESTCGKPNGTAIATANGGSSPYTYIFKGNTSNNAQFSQLLPGNYSLQLADINGCLLNQDFLIGNIGGPTAAIQMVRPISCPQGSDGILEVIDMNAGAIDKISWSNGSTDARITSLTEGTYSVSILDLNGCSSTSSLKISAPANWQLYLDIQPSTCGQANGSAEIQLSGANPPYSVVWSNGQTGLKATGLLAGITIAKVTDSKGCSVESNAVITDAGNLSLSIVNLNPVNCFGQADGSTKVLASGGTAPYQYKWNDGIIGNIRNNLETGQYLVEVTDANGCKAQTSVSITSPDAIAATLSVTGTSCGKDNGTASAKVSGGTSPYFYRWSNGSQLAQISNLPPGSVSVLITDANGCQYSAGEQILKGDGLEVKLETIQEISCYGMKNGAVRIINESDISSAQWSNGAIGTILNNLPAGNYEVIATNNGGCKDTASINLNEPEKFEVEIETNPSTCKLHDGSARINARGGSAPYSYSWSNGMNSNLVEQLAAGNYQVEATDSKGCSLSHSVEIVAAGNLKINNIDIKNVSCKGFTDGYARPEFSGQHGQITYLWSNGQTGGYIENLAAGNYSVNIQDEAGCEAKQSFSINEPDAIDITVLTEDAKCKGNADGSALALVSGGNLPYRYLWDNVSGSEQKKNLKAGNYTVEVRDALGCRFNKDFLIEEPEALNIESVIIQPLCGNDNGSISPNVKGGTMPYSFYWANGETSANLHGLVSGEYSLSVKDQNGCEEKVSYRLLDPGAPKLNTLLSRNISCFGKNDGVIRLNGSGGTGNLEVQWSDTESKTFERFALGSGTYSVVLTDSLGCSDSLSIEISEPLPLKIALTSNHVKCNGGNDGQISTQVEGGTQPYLYQWSNGTRSSSDSLLSALSAGIWGVQVSDANGCKISKETELRQPSALTLKVESYSARCYNNSDGKAVALVNGGIAPYKYRWSNGSTQHYADSLKAGIYQVFVSDSNACNINGKASISHPSKLTGQISGKSEICKGDSVILFASANGGIAPYTFTWANGIRSEKITQTPEADHTYQANVIDGNGCRDDFSKTVNVQKLPTAELLTQQQSICIGNCAELKVRDLPGQDYVWMDHLGNTRKGATVSFCYDHQGDIDYRLFITNEFNCQLSLKVKNMVVVHPLPIVNFDFDKNQVPLLDALIHFENKTQGGYTYEWDFDGRSSEDERSILKNPAYRYNQPGQYPVTLTATSEFGCTASATRFVSILEDFVVYVPNTFTPNHDGNNDLFKVDGIGIADNNFMLTIFNRWGEIVFESQNRFNGWDGRSIKQQDVSEGIYVWQLFIQDFKGDSHKYTGTVTVIR